VYVDVLEPVSTENWAVETLDKHVDEVRTLFEECLHAGHQ
jgi:putative phosphoserine phosphatase/1-acylglycerol-3-phosphate O-acyltransferase